MERLTLLWALRFWALRFWVVRSGIVGGLLVCVGIGIGWAPPLMAVPLDEAERAYRAGRYAEAVPLLRPLAEQGNAKAQFMLGAISRLGLAGSRDEAAAVRWFSQLAEAGFVDLDYDIRALAPISATVPADDPLGIYSFRKPAQNGDPEAQFVFAKIYDQGRGVLENDNLAALWYKTAADQEHAAAAAHYGAMLLQGDGVPPEHEVGLAYLFRAGRHYLSQDRLPEALLVLAMLRVFAPDAVRTALFDERVREQLAEAQ